MDTKAVISEYVKCPKCSTKLKLSQIERSEGETVFCAKCDFKAKNTDFEAIEQNVTATSTAPKKNTKPNILVILLILGTVMMCSIVVRSIDGSLTDTNNNSQKTTDKTSPKPTSTVTAVATEQSSKPGSFETPYKKGVGIQVGDLEYKVVEAKNLGSKLNSQYGSYGDPCRSESGTYLQLKISLTNKGTDKIGFDGVKIVDSQKREFNYASTGITNCVKDAFWLNEDLNPGLTKTIIIVFEIPKDSKGLSIYATPQTFLNSNSVYISTGL